MRPHKGKQAAKGAPAGFFIHLNARNQPSHGGRTHAEKPPAQESRPLPNNPGQARKT